MRGPVESLDRLGIARVPLRQEPPDQDRARRRLDEAVDPEAEQRDAARRERRADRDDSLDDVPTDGGVLESERATEDGSAKRNRADLPPPRGVSRRWATTNRSRVQPPWI